MNSAVKTQESLSEVLGGILNILASESGADAGSGGLASLAPEESRLLGRRRLILAELKPIRNSRPSLPILQTRSIMHNAGGCIAPSLFRSTSY